MKKLKTVNLEDIRNDLPYIMILNNSVFMGTGKKIKRRAKRYNHCFIYELPTTI